MFPFYEIGRVLVLSLPVAFLNPVFWIVIAFVVLQYTRINKLEDKMMGRARESLFRRSVYSILYGIGGGLIGSYILISIGVCVPSSDMIYLLPVALLLMMIEPRFMCFSYSAGLIGISSLIFQWPRVSVPEMGALVAVLHMVESVLIYLNGASGATPVIMEGEEKRAQGGFLMQKFWPIPLTLILIIISNTQSLSGLPWEPSWPSWWPLIKPEVSIPSGYFAEFWVIPIPAVLGYSAVALSCPPEEKANSSAMSLGIYSIFLLILAVLSDRIQPLQYLAVLFAPIGHELVVHLERRKERDRPPLFIAPDDGLMVFHVFPGSIGDRMNFKPGYIIKKINGRAVTSIEDLRECNEASPFYVEMDIEYIKNGNKVTGLETFQGTWSNLGLLFLPKYLEGYYIQVKTNSGFLRRFFGRK